MEVFFENNRWWIIHKESGKFFGYNYSQKIAAEFLANVHKQLWTRQLAGERNDLQRNFVESKSEVKENVL